MSQRLKILAARVDALTLRERAMLFAAAAASIVFLLYALFLNPLLARQALLRAQVTQQQGTIGGIDREITQRLQVYGVDPDAAARSRLAALAAESAQLSNGLRTMQNGLVAPERIAPLLETILKANGRLQLVSMKTLPATAVSEGAVRALAQPAGAAPAPASALLYRHGVELTVRGNYLDMVNYMDALEAMPTRLLWGRAGLEVEEYPTARLTLTLYTLSLDRKWIRL
jgi:MSHA biogenesis protein MshJ